MNLTWFGARGRPVLASLGAAALAACVLTWSVSPTAAMARPDDDTKAAAKDAQDLDTIIFRNGNTVRCKILEETETSVKVQVSVAGISTETTYARNEILDIHRAAKKADAETKVDSKLADSGAVVASAMAADSDGVVDKDGKPIPAGTLKVYIANFGGEFARDVSKTPVTEMMKDVLRVQPDIFIVRFNHHFSRYGEEVVDFGQMGKEQYDMLESAREIDTLISDRIAHDPEFKVKPRRIAWVKKALGGAAFLPFTFPEIYYTPDGLHGGLGGLEHMFDNVGDKVAQEKQYSLRLKRAEGLCIKGGHDERIIRAMSRGDYILSYKLEGGKAVFLERMPQSPDEVVIKNDGVTNEKNRDSLEDLVRGKGKNFLTLDANTAEIIGLSNGTADTVEELLYKMGVTRNYAIVKTKSDKIFKSWSEDVAKAEKDLKKLFRSYQSVQVTGDWDQRAAARGRQKRYLQQALEIAQKYEESLNPRLFGPAESLMSRIRVLLSDIDQAQRLDIKK